MGLIRSLFGSVSVEIKTASVPDLFTAISNAGVDFLDIVQTDELTITGRINRSDIHKLSALLEKRNENIRIKEKYGMYWSLRHIGERPILLIGIVILLVLSVFLPTRVLFFKVEGNQKVPSKQILEAAEKAGINFGVTRQSVRSEKVKNALLVSIPELQWAGINTSGCVAVISVKERLPVDDNLHHSQIASIIASCDGVIESMVVTRGTPVCSVGQAVCKDQVLVSAYTDCGSLIKTTRAEAEIIARTYHQTNAITPANLSKRLETDKRSVRYSLRVGKKLIKLYKDSGISDISCVKICTEHPLKLPGGFILPVTVIKEEIQQSDVVQLPFNDGNDFNWLYQQLEGYLLEQLVAGEILSRSNSLQGIDGVIHASGEYICLESIGLSRDEETEIYGKRS